MDSPIFSLFADMVNAYETNSGELRFKHSLESRQISTSNLCNLLKELHDELSKMDQHTVVISSLSRVKKELYSLISHKDKYVKILVACCIADVLKLHVPDAPYNSQQLRVFNG
jgi:sister-chromatid-cohesion protein PDS5